MFGDPIVKYRSNICNSSKDSKFPEPSSNFKNVIIEEIVGFEFFHDLVKSVRRIGGAFGKQNPIGFDKNSFKRESPTGGRFLIVEKGIEEGHDTAFGTFERTYASQGPCIE